jgi:Flp pilus assembly protein TadD
MRGLLAVIILAWFLTPGQFALASERRIERGAAMREFSVTGQQGRDFKYSVSGKKAILVVFVSAGQERSEKAIKDIRRILSGVSEQKDSFDAVAVVSYPRSGADDGAVAKGAYGAEAGDGLVIADDPDYVLWGKYGVIVTPTAVIGDKEGKVLWVQAGYGYDFAVVVENRLKEALGLEEEKEAQKASEVHTVANATLSARVKRHLQMAKLLRERGRESSAVQEIEKARELDPNSVEAALELAEVYCVKGDGAKAMEAVGAIVGSDRVERAKVLLVKGWASRLGGKLDDAERFLGEAVKEDPKLGRALFELGRVYEAKKDYEKASGAYFRALSLVYQGK